MYVLQQWTNLMMDLSQAYHPVRHLVFFLRSSYFLHLSVFLIISHFHCCLKKAHAKMSFQFHPEHFVSSDKASNPFMGQVLKGLVERRKQVKGWLKRTSDILKYQQLDIQQQALKLTANRFFLNKSGNTIILCIGVIYISIYKR